MLKEYQRRVVDDVEAFFSALDASRSALATAPQLGSFGNATALAFSGSVYASFGDRPVNGKGELYPRVCVKMPTGGGKTLIAVEAIRAFQNIYAKKKTGLVVWITHREQIYRQTIENLQSKSHPYRQLLDQASGNRTLIVEKGQMLRRQDVEENLVVLMLMYQSTGKAANKIFEDSGYVDFFPQENRYDLHKEIKKSVPNLDMTGGTLFEQVQVKTSLANTIRLLNPLFIVDEFHTMFTENAQRILNGLNPSVVVGLSATPKVGMNIVSKVTGRDLKAEEMIKLDMHIVPPTREGDWHSMLAAIKAKQESLEKEAKKLDSNEGTYIRPIALIQVERTGRDQRGQGFVHSEDVREMLIASGVPAHQIAVKSSAMDEIKSQKLLSRESEVRYIITKEALKEGWDCSFAYILGVIPNARNGGAMTQLVGRILRQPYAQKTGIAALDESYVYFASGHTQQVLENVQKGFKDEGLEDVSGGIAVTGVGESSLMGSRIVKIKRAISSKYANSLVLPVWLIKEDNSIRRFSYDIDIRPRIDWDSIKLDMWLKEILPLIKKYSLQEAVISLGGKIVAFKDVDIDETISFDSLYLSRRLTETIDNAFIAYGIASRVIEILADLIDENALNANAGFIAYELEKRLSVHRREQEEIIFEQLLASKILKLSVSDEPALGFMMPEEDIIETAIASAYTRVLYEDVDPNSMNTLERHVAGIIEQSPNVLWWARNRVGKEWYAIQGWRRDKIRPDFIIALKNEKDELEFVYITESKGEQLLGNADTQYKKEVFERMNGLRTEIDASRTRLTSLKLNKRFEFELLPQGEEELLLRSKL